MLHEQFRRAREAKGLSLGALEDRIGVKRQVLAAIDRGAFAELPAGLYGRHAVRVYATAVGLQADAVLEEVGRLLPRLEDPLDGLARVRGFERRWPWVRPRDDQGAPIEEPEPIGDATAGAMDWRPFAAAAIDGGLIAAILGVLAKLTAVAAGAPLSDVAPVALPAWALLVLLIAVTYFVVLGGVRNATFGAAVSGVRIVCSGEPGTLDARAAVRRGMRCALRESWFLVEWLVGNFGYSGRLRALNERG